VGMMDNCGYVTIFETTDQVVLTEYFDEVAITAIFAFGSSQDPISFQM
jgi:hypothetical protein